MSQLQADSSGPQRGQNRLSRCNSGADLIPFWNLDMNNEAQRDGHGSFFLCWCKDMAKDFARSFYSSKQWQDCRNEYAKLKQHLCEDCLRRGIYKPGVIVHHIEELTPFNITNPEIALGFDNLELLCRECHLREHDLEGGRWAKVNAAKRKDKRDARRFSVDEFGRVTARSPLSK